MSKSIKLDLYIRVARAKIIKLIMRGDCIGIINSTDNDITIKFTNDECTVNKWGRVTWADNESQSPKE